MSDATKIKIGEQWFENPIFASSGCFGSGYEMAPYADLGKIGGIMLKTVTPGARPGNKPPRIWEAPHGMLSSIGLQNGGIEPFLRDTMPQVVKACGPGQIIVSIGGDDVEEYVGLVRQLAEVYGPADIAAVEVNGACPNVACGGGSFSKFPDKLEALVAAVARESPFTVIAKINTNFDSYCEAARAAEAGGAAAVHLTNTPIGMAIDIEKRRPALGNVKGPVSGPAIRPMGVAKTWDVYEAVSIPVISSGGVYALEDALEYILAGATAVGVGCAHFLEPGISATLAGELERYLAENGIASCAELVGAAHQM